ncbi:MAG: ABC-2 transporter permease [Clostridiaceae bacterium]
MNAINYLKLDFRIMRDTIRYLALIPAIFIMFSLKSTSLMGLGYLFFFLMIVAATPFSVESNEKCDRMYYMFPSKLSSMVLGRYLYLISTIAIVWIIDGITMLYLYNIKSISMLEVGIICLTGSLASIACLFQYPIYYKLGMEKGRILSGFLYMVPAFIVFSLPSIIKDSCFLTPFVTSIGNKMFFLLIGVLITIVSGIISYLISCSVCEKKEF